VRLRKYGNQIIRNIVDVKSLSSQSIARWRLIVTLSYYLVLN